MPTRKPTRKTRNVLVFAAMSGPQPWRCFFCEEETVKFDLAPPGRGGHRDSPTLHHIDGDHANDVPENWAWAHNSCHTSFHSKGRTPSELANRMASERMKARMAAMTSEERSAAGTRAVRARWARVNIDP